MNALDFDVDNIKARTGRLPLYLKSAVSNFIDVQLVRGSLGVLDVDAQARRDVCLSTVNPEFVLGVRLPGDDALSCALNERNFLVLGITVAQDFHLVRAIFDCTVLHFDGDDIFAGHNGRISDANVPHVVYLLAEAGLRRAFDGQAQQLLLPEHSLDSEVALLPGDPLIDTTAHRGAFLWLYVVGTAHFEYLLSILVVVYFEKVSSTSGVYSEYCLPS